MAKLPPDPHTACRLAYSGKRARLSRLLTYNIRHNNALCLDVPPGSATIVVKAAPIPPASACGDACGEYDSEDSVDDDELFGHTGLHSLALLHLDLVLQPHWDSALEEDWLYKVLKTILSWAFHHILCLQEEFPMRRKI